MVLTVLLSICSLLILLVLIPVQIKVSDTPVLNLSVQWLFIHFQAVKAGDDITTTLSYFGRPSSPKKKKSAPPPKKKKGVKPSSAQKSKKIGFSEIKKIGLSPHLRPILRRCIKFFIHVLKGFKISFLKCDIGLKDFSLQGMITGLTYAVPQNQRISIQCNFMEKNRIDCHVKFYIWKFLLAVGYLLLFFPYLKMYKVIKLIK